MGKKSEEISRRLRAGWNLTQKQSHRRKEIMEVTIWNMEETWKMNTFFTLAGQVFIMLYEMLSRAYLTLQKKEQIHERIVIEYGASLFIGYMEEKIQYEKIDFYTWIISSPWLERYLLCSMKVAGNAELGSTSISELPRTVWLNAAALDKDASLNLPHNACKVLPKRWQNTQFIVSFLIC